MVILVRVAPILGLGLLALILGYQLVSLVPVADRIYLQAAFLGLLFGMVILDTEPGWNMVLFLGFGVAAGMMLRWSGAKIDRHLTWLIFVPLLVISLTGGTILRLKTERTTRVLCISTLFYIIGCVLFIAVSLPGIFHLFWNILGLALFTLVATMVINMAKTPKEEATVIHIAIQLYLVLFNLFWLSSLI